MGSPSGQPQSPELDSVRQVGVRTDCVEPRLEAVPVDRRPLRVQCWPRLNQQQWDHVQPWDAADLDCPS